MIVLCMFISPFLWVDHWWHQNNDVHKELKQIFPDADSSNELSPRGNPHGSYDILQICLERSGFSKNAIIQTFRSGLGYQLWYLLPFSVSPPPHSIFKTVSNFKWVVSHDMRIVALLLPSKLIILEQTQMQKGSLGSWHERQNFPLEKDISQISMTADGFCIIIGGPNQLYAVNLTKASPVEYTIRRIMMNHCKSDFTFCAGGLTDSYLLTANPYYNQTDGMVMVYRIEKSELKLLATVNPPIRASFFGAQSVLTSNKLFVSAPLANKGSGCVYVYDTTSWGLILKIDRKEALQFGKMIGVSDNGEYIAILSHPANISIYRKTSNRDGLQYNYKQNIRFDISICNMNDLQSCFDVDNNGTLLVSYKHKVYYYMGDSAYDFVVGRDYSKVAKLSYVSPNRLRILRGLQMHNRSRSADWGGLESQPLKIKSNDPKLFSIPEKVNLESLHHVTTKLGIDGFTIGIV